MGSRGGAVSNNLSDFSQQSYRSKTRNISSKSKNRESFLANCCPKCPVFEGSKIRNLLRHIVLSVVHTSEVDKVFFGVIPFPIWTCLLPFSGQFFLQRIQNEPIHPLPDIRRKSDRLEITILIPVSKVIGLNFFV